MLGDLNINQYENGTLFRVREKNKIIEKFTNKDLKQKNVQNFAKRLDLNK